MAMRVLCLMCVLTFAGHASQEKVCSFQDVLNYLNLTRDNEAYTSSRPVRNWKNVTTVHLDVHLFAILAVVEKSQMFSPFIWVLVTWNNDLISWDPSQFCGITKLSVPKDMLWRPDVFIHEITEKEQGLGSTFLDIYCNGTITMGEDLRIVITCRMDVYKFPFDTQSCDMTFGCITHTVNDIQLWPHSNSTRATQLSKELLQNQGEWEFLNLSVVKTKLTYNHGEWDLLKYTITMRRRPLLHVINFLLPILFFLTLDIASFFISDKHGGKLGFKVTVLLAISVLLLILNDILPSVSNRTPLIATYCVVIFAFMLLSLLETVLVTYLMSKDRDAETPTDNGTPTGSCETPVASRSGGPAVADGKSTKQESSASTCVTGVETLPGCQRVTEEVCGHTRQADRQSSRLIPPQLQELWQKRSACTKGCVEKTPRHWAQAAKRINAVFFCFYLPGIFLFLVLLFIERMA